MVDFVGGPGPDGFNGSTTDDTANGAGGDDTLRGNEGNDRLQGGEGSDLIEGGDGDDYLASHYFLRPDLLLPGHLRLQPSTDTGTEIDTLVGGDGHDWLFAGYGDNVAGGAGENTLFINFQGATSGVVADFRAAVNGSIVVGGGTISGVYYTGYIAGSNFADTIYSRGPQSGMIGTALGEVGVFGYGGDDIIVTGEPDNYVSGGDGNDTIDATASRPSGYLYGDGGNDTITARGDTLAFVFGGDGNDVLAGGFQIHGGNGDDQITVTGRAIGDLPPAFWGDEGNDTLNGDTNANSLFGGVGADVIHGGGGNDRIGSFDSADYTYLPLADNGAEHDQLYGDAGDDLIAAGYGDNADGGANIDTLWLTLASGTSGVTLDTTNIVNGGTVVVGGGTIHNFESLARLTGTGFNDTITFAAQGAAATIDLGGGNDWIMWSTGAVSVSGGSGDDRFVNGSGADTIDGGIGTDTLDYANAIAGMTATLARYDANYGTGSGGDILRSIENIDGSAFGDSFTGSDTANLLRGLDGNDTLRGMVGADTLVGGAGDDTLDGGTGQDVAVFSGLSSAYTITELSNHTWQVSGTDGTDTITGIERLQFDDGAAVFQTGSFDAASQRSDGFGHAASSGGWASFDVAPRTAADVNGDGRADLIGFGAAGTYVALADASGNYGALTLATATMGSSEAAGSWTSQNLYPRMAADVNGDGMADLVGFNRDGVEVSLATGGGAFGATNQVLAAFGTNAGGWSNETTYPRMMADVNGDGRADIVGFGDGGVLVSLATEQGGFGALTLALDGFGASASHGGWSDNNRYPRMMADINGDGMADIVGFGDAGVFVSLATGSGQFGAIYQAYSGFGASATAGGWANNGVYPRMMGDINGDGMADIVGFGDAGVYAALADGQGGFDAIQMVYSGFGASDAAGGWATNDLYPRTLADVNADGMVDIVGFGENGVFAASAASGEWVFV